MLVSQAIRGKARAYGRRLLTDCNALVRQAMGARLGRWLQASYGLQCASPPSHGGKARADGYRLLTDCNALVSQAIGGKARADGYRLLTD